MKCPVERECRRRSSLHEKLFGQLGHRKAPRSRLARSCSLTILSPVNFSEHNGQMISADAEIRERQPLATAKSSGGVSCAITATGFKDAQSLTLTKSACELKLVVLLLTSRLQEKYNKSAIIIHCEIQSPNPKSEEANSTLRNAC